MTQEDLTSLADVQRLLLPDNPCIAGLEYAIHYQPAEIAAGDYYDLMALTHRAEDFDRTSGSDIWGLIIGDVSGHGAAAAMEAVQFDAILRTYRGDEDPGGPAGALTYANRYFFSRRARRHFLTAFAASYRPDRRELQYVSAGHPPALLIRDQTIHRIGDEGEIPLGVVREHRFANSTVSLLPGDLLVAFTDGIVEARDERGEQMGLDRVEHVLRSVAPHPDMMLQALCAALFAHQNGGVGLDDQTIIVLRQLG